MSDPTGQQDSEKVEQIARFLAIRFKAIESRRSDEPIDVCRFHREIAEELLKTRVVPQQGGPDEAEALCMFCGTRGELPSGDCALCTVRELTAALSMALVELEPEGGTDPWRDKVILKARDALAARSGEGTGDP